MALLAEVESANTAAKNTITNATMPLNRVQEILIALNEDIEQKDRKIADLGLLLEPLPLHSAKCLYNDLLVILAKVKGQLDAILGLVSNFERLEDMFAAILNDMGCHDQLPQRDGLAPAAAGLTSENLVDYESVLAVLREELQFKQDQLDVLDELQFPSLSTKFLYEEIRRNFNHMFSEFGDLVPIDDDLTELDTKLDAVEQDVDYQLRSELTLKFEKELKHDQRSKVSGPITTPRNGPKAMRYTPATEELEDHGLITPKEQPYIQIEDNGAGGRTSNSHYDADNFKIIKSLLLNGDRNASSYYNYESEKAATIQHSAGEEQGDHPPELEMNGRDDDKPDARERVEEDGERVGSARKSSRIITKTQKVLENLGDEFEEGTFSNFEQEQLRQLTEQKQQPEVEEPPLTAGWQRCDWPGCKRVFANNTSISVHYRSHTVVKPYVCDFPTCERRFTMVRHMKLHVRNVHKSSIKRKRSKSPPAGKSGERLHCKWEGCEAIFPTHDDLSAHSRRHTGRVTYPCQVGEKVDDCRREFPKLSGLRHHRTLVHPKGQNLEKARSRMGQMFECEEAGCGRTFGTLANLRIHHRVHTGEKPYRCVLTFCRRKFSDRSNFRRHQILHVKQGDGYPGMSSDGKTIPKPRARN